MKYDALTGKLAPGSTWGTTEEGRQLCSDHRTSDAVTRDSLIYRYFSRMLEPVPRE